MTLLKRRFWKHCGKRRKCWLPAFSPFPAMFSILSKREIIVLAIFFLSSANVFNFRKSNSLSFDKDLTLSQTTNFRLFQTERVCRRQFQTWWKGQKVILTGRKHWEKEKLLVTSNFSISHSVFKGPVLQTCKNQGLFGKGLISRMADFLFCAFFFYKCIFELDPSLKYCFQFFFSTVFSCF